MTSEDPIDDLAAPAVTPERLVLEYRSIRSMFYLALVSMIILEGSVCLFLLRELTLVRRQSRELKVFVNDYNRNSVPVMEDFRVKLEDFAKMHPDFLPILRRYFSTTNEPAASYLGPVIKPAASSTER